MFRYFVNAKTFRFIPDLNAQVVSWWQNSFNQIQKDLLVVPNCNRKMTRLPFRKTILLLWFFCVLEILVLLKMLRLLKEVYLKRNTERRGSQEKYLREYKSQRSLTSLSSNDATDIVIKNSPIKELKGRGKVLNNTILWKNRWKIDESIHWKLPPFSTFTLKEKRKNKLAVRYYLKREIRFLVLLRNWKSVLGL